MSYAKPSPLANPQHASGRAPGFTLLELLLVVAILVALAGLVIPMVSHSEEQAKETAALASITGVRDGFIGTGAMPGLYSDIRYIPGVNSNLLRVGHLLARPTTSPTLPEYDSASRKGWRGPYARGGHVRTTSTTGGATYPAPSDIRYEGDTTFGARGFHPSDAVYGTAAEPALGDAWGNPFVLQIPTSDKNGNAFTSNEDAWRYARIVSAGPDGKLDTVLDGVHLSALAGKLSDNTAPSRGDDIVLYLNRADVYEP